MGKGLKTPKFNMIKTIDIKPPIFTFLACVLLCGVAILCMGFYVEFSGPVINPNVKEKWLNFLSNLSSLDICVFTGPDNTGSVDTAAVAQVVQGPKFNLTSTKYSSITVSASMHLISGFENLPTTKNVAAYGTINLGHPTAILDGHYIDKLRMSFAIPRDLTETSPQDACVILSYRPDFLPSNKRTNICLPSLMNASVILIGTVWDMNSNGSNTCKEGTHVKLNYNRKSEHDFYLSKAEKLNIYVRLLHASYYIFGFAFFLVILILIYARISMDNPSFKVQLTV